MASLWFVFFPDDTLWSVWCSCCCHWRGNGQQSQFSTCEICPHFQPVYCKKDCAFLAYNTFGQSPLTSVMPSLEMKSKVSDVNVIPRFWGYLAELYTLILSCNRGILFWQVNSPYLKNKSNCTSSFPNIIPFLSISWNCKIGGNLLCNAWKVAIWIPFLVGHVCPWK